MSVELPTSVDNVTLLAFAAERRAAVRSAARRQAAAAVDQYLPRAGPTAANPLLQRSTDGTEWRMDRPTDAVPLHRPWRILREQCQQHVVAANTHTHTHTHTPV